MTNKNTQVLIQELKEILNNRESVIFENYQNVREEYKKDYEWPELDTLRHEAVLAIIFDLNQAAITFINHMLEALLKISIGYFDSFENFKKNKEEFVDDKSIQGLIDQLKPNFKNVDGKNLNDTINMATKRGLITEKQRDQLHVYRNSLRNAYSHAEKGKIFGEITVPIQGVHLNENLDFEIEAETEQKISDIPFIQGMAQYYHAKRNALLYFKYVDSLTRQIKVILFPNKDDWGC